MSGSTVCLPPATSLLCHVCSNASPTQGFLERPAAMDSSGMEALCKNSTFGCTFVSSPVEYMVNHFQGDCAFHPVHCFKCNKMVPKMNFAKHYEQCCKDSSASPCSRPENDVAEASATGKSRNFPLECVTECTVCVKSACSGMKVVATDVAEVKVMKEEKQQDLEAIVKSQGDVIQELGKSISVVVEKVNKVQEDVGGLVNRLDKDAGTIVERVENVEGLVKDCVKENKSCAKRLSRVMRNVAAGVAEMKVIKKQHQDVKATLKKQGGLVKKLGRNIMVNAEKVNKVERGVGTIVQRGEQLDDLVKDVSEIKRGIADQSRVHWYVENVSQYIEKAKTDQLYVKSEVFVVRGYSAKLWFQVEKRETALCIGLFLCLCRGPNDSLLQWPFRIPYTLSLIHPKDAFKTKEYKGTPPTTGHHCFEKPKNEESPGAGTRNLCTVGVAQNEGFIENDAVCFALTLHE